MGVPAEKLDWQILKREGRPAFAAIPYEQYLKLITDDDVVFPNDVIGLEIEHDNILKAWRLYLGKTQKDLASSCGISPAAVSQMEKAGAKPQKGTLRKMAAALGIDPRQLDFSS